MLKHIPNMWGVIMRNKMNKYVLLAIAMGILLPINYFLFQGSPSADVEATEEQILKDLTGIEVHLNPQ